MSELSGVCRICGCTEQSPCVSARPRPGMIEPVIDRGLDGNGDAVYFVCAWFDRDRDLCTNHHCMHQAYLQACGSSPATQITSISI
jgi:hypothetical protein